jgi:Mg2+/Co2+ transporter CorB
MDVWHYIMIIVVLQLFSAFFSGSETALTTSSRARLHQMAHEGNRRAGLAYALQEKKEKLLGSLLVGNNLVNNAAAAAGTAMMTELFGGDAGTGALIATLGITVTMLIFSEVLPKTYAIHNATATAVAVSPFLRVIIWMITPATWAIVKIVRGILILIGSNPNNVSVSNSVEELKGAIDLHRGPDAEVAQERAMLRSILDLNEVDVQEIMTHRGKVVHGGSLAAGA